MGDLKPDVVQYDFVPLTEGQRMMIETGSLPPSFDNRNRRPLIWRRSDRRNSKSET